MKVFTVLYETVQGQHIIALLIMRKVYGKPAIAVRRWSDAANLSEIRTFTTENYSRAADMYLSHNDDDFYKILSIGEVMLQ